MPYVLSTLAAGVDYVEYKSQGNGINTPIRKVSIKGGGGVAQRIHALNGEALTRPGEITEITEDDAEFLMKNETFKTHLEKGHVKILKSFVKVEKGVRDMDRADPSRPLTDGDFEQGGRATGAHLHSIGAQT